MMVLDFRIVFILVFAFVIGSCKNDNNHTEPSLKSKDINIIVKSEDRKYVDLYSSFDEMASINISNKINREIAAVKSNGKWGLLNFYGDTIVPFNYDNFSSNEATFVLSNKNQQDYYNGSFEHVGSSFFNNIEARFSKFYIGFDSTKQVLVDSIGNTISTKEFDDIMVPRSGNYYLGKAADKWESYPLGHITDSIHNYMRLATELMNTAKVTLRGYGPFRLGMTLEEMNNIYKEVPLQITFNEPYCKMGDFGENFPSFYCLFEESNKKITLERIYIQDSAIKTKSGIGIGNTKEELITVYGDKIKTEQHKYDPNGSYLYFIPVDKVDKDYRINFNYDGLKINGYSLGRMPAVMYVEGCM